MAIPYKEYRCHTCHKLLFKGILVESEIEIKCKHCHNLNTFESTQFNEMLCAIVPCPHRVVPINQKHSP